MATDMRKEGAYVNEVSLKDIVLKLQEWIKYLLSRWYVLLVASLIGGALGFLYADNKTPKYIATTTFVLEGAEKSGLSQYAGMAAMVGVNLAGGSSGLFQGDNILELYKSRKMLEKALLTRTSIDSDELLINRFIAANNFEEAWFDRPDLLKINFNSEPSDLNSESLRLRDSLITSFTNSIREGVLQVSRPDEKLSIIKVDVSFTDEVFAKQFNEALVANVNNFYVQTKTAKSSKRIETLQFKVDSVYAVMTGAISEAANVIDATPNLNPVRQAQRVVPTQRAQFSAETNKAILGQLVQNLELSKMNLLQEQPLIQTIDQPVFPLEAVRFGKVKGVIIGSFLCGFISVLFLILVQTYRDIMQ